MTPNPKHLPLHHGTRGCKQLISLVSHSLCRVQVPIQPQPGSTGKWPHHSRAVGAAHWKFATHCRLGSCTPAQHRCSTPEMPCQCIKQTTGYQATCQHQHGGQCYRKCKARCPACMEILDPVDLATAQVDIPMLQQTVSSCQHAPNLGSTQAIKVATASRCLGQWSVGILHCNAAMPSMVCIITTSLNSVGKC